LKDVINNCRNNSSKATDYYVRDKWKAVFENLQAGSSCTFLISNEDIPTKKLEITVQIENNTDVIVKYEGITIEVYAKSFPHPTKDDFHEFLHDGAKRLQEHIKDYFSEVKISHDDCMYFVVYMVNTFMGQAMDNGSAVFNILNVLKSSKK